MKVITYQSDDERLVLTGMIVSDRILSRIYSHLKSERKPFKSRWSNLVAKWCLDYFSSYQKAPRSHLAVLFRHHAESSQDGESVDLIEKFLSSLDEDYQRMSEELNEDHLVDVASRHFNQVKLELLSQGIEADLLRRDVEEARQKVATFQPINLAMSDVVKVFTNKQAILEALSSEENEVMIRYPGALGEFFDIHLQRDGFVAFLAPEKRGKSFWLMDLAWRAAVLNRRRTFFYSVGDLSQRQMMRRLLTRTLRRPLKARGIRIPRRVVVREGVSRVRFKEEEYSHPASIAEVKRALKRVKMRTASSSSLLRLKCTSNSTTTVADIRTDLDEAAREGWIPDVIVVDYADILAPEIGQASQEYRHQINETWKALRRLSQDYHILVVTATQSDAASYETEMLRRRHFSEDKRKLSHVTGMIGLNQTEEEKGREIFRLNWILLREGIYYESRCVTVAGCLAIANPAMVSTW